MWSCRFPALLAVLTLAACSRDDGQSEVPAPEAAPDVAELAAAACTGARTELAALTAVTGGRRAFADAALRSQFLEELAVEQAAPAAVQSDLARWKAEVERREQALRDLPPRYADGQLLEPDTGPADQAFIAAMRPLGQRLGVWVEDACARGRPAAGN